MAEEKYLKTIRKVSGTDSCAAAATKAATLMLLSGSAVKKISFMAPDGKEVVIRIEDVKISEYEVSCAVKKDSGDDPEIAKDILIYSTVTRKETEGITLKAGNGIGTVVGEIEGLQKGDYAIGTKAREAILSSAKYICEEVDYKNGLEIVISAPYGKSVAKTDGVRGGIAIVGKSKMVAPMSPSETKRSIRLEVGNMAKRFDYLAAAPGNNGETFAKEEFDIPMDRVVRSNDYIGDTISFCNELNIKGIVFIGHVGKLVKLGAGILNTHSQSGDGRLEVLVTCAIKAGASSALLSEIVNCITIDEALDLLKAAGILKEAMDALSLKIEKHLTRTSAHLEIGAVVFSNKHGILCTTSKAEELIEKIKGQVPHELSKRNNSR